MTLTLLDLYNAAATQEWSMYDNDAETSNEMESSLVLAVNKAILEIYSSYNFPFRERTHVIVTIPRISDYDAPSGLIKRDKGGKYMVRYGAKIIRHIDNSSCLPPACGVPEGFYVKNNKVVLYPIPCCRDIVTIDYYTLVIGETAQGEEIYSLKNADDILTIPVHLEEIAKDAIITRTMLNSISSESDENYSAYKKQADKAYKLLVKYSKGMGQDKKVCM